MRTALAADTVSITVMEIVDNAFLVLLPGAMEATLSSALFWWSLAAALAVAFVVTVPVNRWMIGRGKGHAVVHEITRITDRWSRRAVRPVTRPREPSATLTGPRDGRCATSSTSVGGH